MKVGQVVRRLAKWTAIAVFAASLTAGIAGAAYGYFWGIAPAALALSVVILALGGGFIAFVIALAGYAAFPPGRD